MLQGGDPARAHRTLLTSLERGLGLAGRALTRLALGQEPQMLRPVQGQALGLILGGTQILWGGDPVRGHQISLTSLARGLGLAARALTSLARGQEPQLLLTSLAQGLGLAGRTLTGWGQGQQQ